MKSITLFITVLLNGLSAGFFFAWSVSVILGTKKVGDSTYLETMQNINREILNPLFFLVFFGSLLMLIVSIWLPSNSKLSFLLILSSALVYFIGTFGVTALGNVPLNNELDTLSLHNLSVTELNEFRIYYEIKWNLYHTIRTIANLVSFVLLLISIFIKK